MDWINLHAVVNAITFSVLGLVVLAVAFIVFDRLTPGHLWKEIVEEQNRALAIVVGAFTLGIALIIAASISG
jgi:uncharacterized membrane protein YjfL (UPF0719 family)